MLEEKVQSSHKKADNRDNTWIYHMLWAVKQQHCWWDDSDKKFTSAAISLRLQGKLSFPYNCQKMNGQIYVLLC